MSDSMREMNIMKWMCVVMVIIAIEAARGCPSDVCVCKWKGGKQSVECGGRFLADLPDGMEADTQILNFTGNNLQYLMSERFYKMDLINLQKIYLSRNQLTRIHDKAFRGLSNLVDLDLSENMLTTIPSETFQDYTSLMRLILSGNPIREVKANAFKHLSFLTTLELSNCQLSRIEDEAFIGLDNLEWLKLDGNRIQVLRGNHILPQSLHGINMQGNGWNCDCKMVDLHAWLVNYNVPQQGEDPKCMSPERLAGEAIKFLKTDDLACMPNVSPAKLFFEISEGQNISLQCKIVAVPEPTITWWFQGHQVTLNESFAATSRLFYITEEGGEEKHSDLYIFNASPEDNGTYSCVAENSAGRIQANYTIRMLIKEEPVVEEITFSYEHFLIIIIGAGVAAFFIVLTCCCIIIKCRRKAKRSRKRQESAKDSTMQLQSNQIKCSSIMADGHMPTPILKNGTLSNQQQDLMLYVTQNANLSQEMPPIAGSQYCSPSSMRNYQEQNPDLINDAESGGRLKSDADDAASEQGSIGPSSVQGSHASCENGYHPSAKLMRNAAQRYNAMGTLPRGGLNKDLYQHQVDVHLNPGCFLNQDGYATDYRLQPMPLMSSLMSPSPQSNQVNYYRTLPHKPKAQSALSHGVRFSMEAEFLNRTTTPPFDTYNLSKDIRYTAEGYPKHQKQVAFADQQFPSPPDEYKSDKIGQTTTVGVISTTTASATLKQWPPCLPGYHSQIVPIKTQGTDQKQRYPPPSLMSPNSLTTATTMTKRCVGAQTNALHDNDVIPEQQEEEAACETTTENSKLRHLTGPLADSPDEGYVGDSQDVSAPDM